MDYFNELLDSYNRLKKRTFKLRYIQEETSEELTQRGFKYNPGKIGPNGKYQGYFYSGDQFYVSSDPPKTENKTYFLLDDEAEEEKSRTERDTIGSKLYQELPEEYQTEENRKYINGISKSLSKMCESIVAKFKTAATKYVSCAEKIVDYLSFNKRSQDSLGKLFSKTGTTQGITINRDEEGNIKKDEKGNFEIDVSEGMGNIEEHVRSKILQNLHDVLEEITSENPNCEKIAGKVAKTKITQGKTKKDRFIIYGGDNTEGIVLPGAGAITSIIAASAMDMCGEIEKIYDDAVSRAGINAKAGTLSERLFALGHELYALTIEPDPERAKKLVTELAKNLLESEAVTQSLVDAFDINMITLEEESAYYTLLQDHELFKNKDELSKLLILFVKANEDLYKKMGADKIIPYGAKSKQGARADNMLVYTTEEAAKKAARSVGFVDKESNEPVEGNDYEKTTVEEFLKNIPEKNKSKVRAQLKELGLDESSEFYTIGLGQKLYTSFKDSKLGEYNRISRLFMAVLGAIPETDRYYSEDFNKAVSSYPIDKDTSAFIEGLETERQFIEDVLAGGEEFLNSKGIKESAPERYEFAQDILKQASTPQGEWAKLDPKNKADQQYIKEYIQRFTMVNKLKNRFENSETSSSTYDAILRMSFVTGGNAKELLQLTISKEDNSTRVFRQNAIFEELRDNKDKYTLEFTKSGVRFVDKETGQLVGKLNFSRTGSKDSPTPYARTRTDFEISDWAQKNIAKAEERKIESMENSSTLSELLSNHIELLTELLKQTKKN